MFKFIASLFQSKTSKDKAKLTELLSNPKYKFRSLSRLMRATKSVDRASTVNLLGDIGARPAYRDNELWALTSRAGTGKRRDRVSGGGGYGGARY